MPADGNRAANLEAGDFGRSPVFVQLSDKPLLASMGYLGCRNAKHNGRTGKLIECVSTRVAYTE
jgi:hypothetical protein